MPSLRKHSFWCRYQWSDLWGAGSGKFRTSGVDPGLVGDVLSQIPVLDVGVSRLFYLYIFVTGSQELCRHLFFCMLTVMYIANCKEAEQNQWIWGIPQDFKKNSTYYREFVYYGFSVIGKGIALAGCAIGAGCALIAGIGPGIGEGNAVAKCSGSNRTSAWNAKVMLHLRCFLVVLSQRQLVFMVL